MNRIYRNVWNKSLSVWAVASELTSSVSLDVVASASRIDRRHGVAVAVATALALGGAGFAAPFRACAQSVQVGRSAAELASNFTGIGTNGPDSATSVHDSASQVNGSALVRRVKAIGENTLALGR